MNESKISKRQLTRMIYIEGVGASGLTFPAAAALHSNSEGFFPLLLYALLLPLFVGWLLFLIHPSGEEKSGGHVRRLRFCPQQMDGHPLYDPSVYQCAGSLLLLRTVHPENLHAGRQPAHDPSAFCPAALVLYPDNSAKTCPFSGTAVSVGDGAVCDSGVLCDSRPGREGPSAGVAG